MLAIRLRSFPLDLATLPVSQCLFFTVPFPRHSFAPSLRCFSLLSHFTSKKIMGIEG